MKRLVGILFLFISLSSCEKELNIDLPFEGSRLVIYCLMNPDSAWSVKVGKTIPATGDHALDWGIETARVVVLEDGIAIDTLQHTGQGRYRSASAKGPRFNHDYQLNVQATNFPTAETLSEHLPDPVTVDKFRFDESVSSPFGSGKKAKKLLLTLRDDQQRINKYSVQVSGYYKGIYNALSIFGINRPDDVEDLCGFRTTENTFVLKDDCFNQGLFTVQLGVELTGFVQAELQEPGNLSNTRDADQIVCRVLSLSDSYYRYLKSYYQPEGFETIFNQPQNVYSNVKGGYGILAAYQQKVVIIL